MGRKDNTKAKEKRQKRKEEQNRIKQAKEVVDKANKLEDPLEPFAIFRKFNKNGIDAQLYVKRVTALEESVRKWIFDLTKRNMETEYEKCSWGWNDNKKNEELMDEAAWYLVAQSENGDLLGFSHFRFDLDEGMEVLYCYELQLEPSVHRKSLGRFMMQILELMAFTNNMRKVVLTALKHNTSSLFFKAMKYQLDESSPMDDEEEEYPYEILSKVNKKLVTHHHSLNGHGVIHSQCCPGH